MSRSPDTSPEAEAVQLGLLRRATVAQRAALALSLSLSRTAIELPRSRRCFNAR